MALYMMKENEMQYNEVVEADKYIGNILDEYIASGKKGFATYTVVQDGNNINFSLKEYDAVGLKGNYDDFYEYRDADDKLTLVSYNKEKLRGFCAYINRLTM